MRNYPFLEGLHKFKKYPLNDQNSLFCISWKHTLRFEEVIFLEAVARAWRKNSHASPFLLFKPKWGCILIIPTCLKLQLWAQNPTTGRGGGVLCGGIARKGAQRTNVLLSLRSPDLDRAVPPTQPGTRTEPLREPGRVFLPSVQSFGWAPRAGAAQGALGSGQRKEPTAVRIAQIPPHQKQKPRMLESE